MANYEIRRRASIGSASLILIFIVLCLATFGILSLGNARREDALSERSAAAVKAYYRADSQAEEFVGMVARALHSADGKEAAQEAGRCLRCDHYGYGNLKGGRAAIW